MVNHPRRAVRKATVVAAHDHAFDYDLFLKSARGQFNGLAENNTPLFQTDAIGLFDLFLDALPQERQYHTCSCCRAFFKAYGGLVRINENGAAISALWDPDTAPEFYRPAIVALHKAVNKARVTGVFLTSKSAMGVPEAGGFTHISAVAPRAAMWENKLLTPGQRVAVVRENRKTVLASLADFSPDLLNEALRVLTAKALRDSERFIGPVKFLLDMHARPKGRAGDNAAWRMIAAAPDGFCHPRASVVGTLLEDIAAGLSFEDVARRFNAKMHPLAYQRPQAPPTAGNVKAAEEAFAKLGLARSLERRFARLDECETLWRPAAADADAPDGLFGHLKTKKPAAAVSRLVLPPQVMTWARFTAEVLPGAEEMDVFAPAYGNYMAHVTAVHADAPLLWKWDNPVSHYVYHSGSSAHRWRVKAGWVKVTGIVQTPAMWGDRPQPFLGAGACLVLDGAADTNTGQGNALFPVSMRGDLHTYRATIEAYSKSAVISGVNEASACGLGIDENSTNTRVRVKVGGVWTDYTIDRWV
jgi:hypothetical protein